jgi:DHA1 family multidrug resistance protein-like MFS transporter
MAELIRDTSFGHIVRFVTKKRCLQYLEESDPNLWKKYVNEEKSGYLAHHGSAQPLDGASEDSDVKSLEELGGVRTRDARERELETSTGLHAPTQARAPEERANYNDASGVRIDPEKGRDLHVIDFLENDPEVGISHFLQVSRLIIK